METVILISQVIMGLALVLTFVRVVRGPSLPDRVVALELFSTTVVGLVGVYDSIGRLELLGRRDRDCADGLFSRHWLCALFRTWRAAG